MILMMKPMLVQLVTMMLVHIMLLTRNMFKIAIVLTILLLLLQLMNMLSMIIMLMMLPLIVKLVMITVENR
jgi:hypothetical protein